MRQTREISSHLWACLTRWRLVLKSNSAVSSVGGAKLTGSAPPSESTRCHLAVLTGQCTQREAADKWKVDRLIRATAICRSAEEGGLAALSARPGRPGKSPGQVEIEEARAPSCERLGPRSPAGGGLPPLRGKIALGLTVGPVPPGWTHPSRPGCWICSTTLPRRLVGPGRVPSA